ncbi:MAG TPA: PsiF family protein [Burkholderiales bacterium]|nr:PsiF family protein [Burkholderiales bacterium]
MRVWPLLALLAFHGCAMAADGLTPAQQRMRACNTEAKHKHLRGTARSRFLTDCLNGRKGDRPLTPLQAKDEACTKEADARRLEGAERRGFMSECTKPDRVKAETAQRVRLQNCNRRADGRKLDGDERRKFVSGCLGGAAAASSEPSTQLFQRLYRLAHDEPLVIREEVGSGESVVTMLDQRQCGSASTRSAVQARKKPRMKLPLTLTISVP